MSRQIVDPPESSDHANVRTRMEFLWKGAIKYSKTSPSLSRYFMTLCTRRIHQSGLLKLPDTAERYSCRFCGNLWIAGNCSMKFASKRKLPKSIETLRNKNPKKLTINQIRILKMQDNWSVKRVQCNKYIQVYRCGVCKKVSRTRLRIPIDERKCSSDPRIELMSGRKNSTPQQTKQNLKNTKFSHDRLTKSSKKDAKKVRQMDHKLRTRKHTSESRERLMDQIRETKTDCNHSKTTKNNKLVSTVKRILKSDARDDKVKPGHQLLAFLSNM